MSAPQPRLWSVILWFAVVNWLPTISIYALIQLPTVSNFTKQHNEAYHTGFFFVQLGLLFAAVAFFSAKYAAAIWIPQSISIRGIAKSLAILFPILLFYLPNLILVIPNTFTLLKFGADGVSELNNIYYQVWNQLAYKSSLEGVIFSSIMSFASPVFEEMVFRGFLLNNLTGRYGVAIAILGSSICFAIVHAIQFGFGVQLFPLFFCGLTYALIRTVSGSLLLAIFAHWIINTVIFFPKWIIAAIHFSHS